MDPFRIEYALFDPAQPLKVLLTLACWEEGGVRWSIGLQVGETAEFAVMVPPPDHKAAAEMARDGVCVEQRGQAFTAARVVQNHIQGMSSRQQVDDAILRILRVG